APDEDRRVVEVGRAARENGAVDQRLDIALLDPAVAQHRVRARVVAHDAIEYAGVAVHVQLEQKLLHPRLLTLTTRRTTGDTRRSPPSFLCGRAVGSPPASRRDELLRARSERMPRRGLAADHVVHLRLAAQRPGDRLLRGLVVVLEDLAVVLRLPVDEDRDEHAEVIHLVLRDDPL